MQYKLLSIENKAVINIGDYVQALASAQFLPQVDGFVNRENLSGYCGEECKVIMNGWYMHDPTKWPPNNQVKPLFVALHINKLASEKMLDAKGVDYFRKFEPIGCRDYHTLELLQKHGINAYFSGCMTLTLGHKYKSTSNSGKVYFVDPIIPHASGFMEYIRDICFMLLNYRLVSHIRRKMTLSHHKILNYLKVSRFARIYSSLFEKRALRDAIYIEQQNNYYGTLSNEERLKEAERLVKQYAEASFVVTRRIHCALPCLGLGTPVYFIQNTEDSDISTCRFGGLVDMFNRIKITGYHLTPDFNLCGKLSVNNVVANKDTWRPFAKTLTERCLKFISQ